MSYCLYYPQALLPYVDQLSPVIIDCVRDPFYKITSDALLVLQDLVKVDGVHFTTLIEQNLKSASNFKTGEDESKLER